MMAVQDSDDYELMPKQELEDLRRQVSALRKNSMGEGDKAHVLIESMDRLTISINRLITILDDAQRDIIEEYQQSKPTEKLNRILEQNETIARALLAVHDNLIGERSNIVPSSAGQKSMFSKSDQLQNAMQPPDQKTSLADNPYSMMPPSMPSMDDFSAMKDLPPLDNPPPNIPPKKKFLGIM
jgi:hypothetical protein